MRLQPKQKAEFVKKLSPDDWSYYYWLFRARNSQLEPTGDWIHWLILCGRGWGKGETGTNTIKNWVDQGLAKRILITAPTRGAIDKFCIAGKTGFKELYHKFPDQPQPHFVLSGSDPRIEFPNGARADLISAEEPDRYRGANYDAYWFDELAAVPANKADYVWEQVLASLRGCEHPRGIITTTPRPTPLIKRLTDNAEALNIHLTRGTTLENKALPQSYVKQLSLNLTETQYRQEVLAEIIEDVQGALWTNSLIDRNRIKEIPDLKRIVIGVDPSVTANKKSDETGIVVAGVSYNNTYYVLADYSGKYTPKGWADKVKFAYEAHKADRVIVEDNQGGDLVESNLRTCSIDLPIKRTHSIRGKQLRAEPIAGLYEQNRVKHYSPDDVITAKSPLSTLESQMTTWVSGDSKSPDRLDALVFALTELKGQNSIQNINMHLLRAYSDR